jgi:hypothetical protein
MLRSQVNNEFPNRGKADDGTIAGAAHHVQNPTSDHEPNSLGVVRALDLTHSPARGFDSYKFAEVLRLNRDPRLKYVISNRRIFSSPLFTSKYPAWVWRTYVIPPGGDPHTGHVHISVLNVPSRYDDTSHWSIGAPPIVMPVIPVPSHPPPLATPNSPVSQIRESWWQALLRRLF